jgi:hypothetical protein
MVNFTPRGRTPLPTEREAGMVFKASLDGFGEEENWLFLPGIEIRTVQPIITAYNIGS